MDWLSTAAGILGGVGLFLLGMRLMTDGLRVAAGRALRGILERGTSSRFRAVLSGAAITGVVQSSSAVTVAVIGFANAGLLTLAQAVAVIYGSNVGTTATGWLVALIGLNVNVKALALPSIGLGMAFRLVASGRRLGAVGEAMAGFGLFFLGIDVLKSSLAGLEGALPLGSVAVTGIAAIALFTLIGVGLTVLMQSSSAAIAIILTSVSGGVIPIEAGASLVIGANIGTTSTAGLAVIGATSNAKRVAVAHVAFNLMTGAVALLTLPLLLLLVGRFRTALGQSAEPAAVVAAFHTLFNVLGVALMWPLTNRLVASLEGRFRTLEEQQGTPRYLDRNVLSTPTLAARALGLELARIGSIARELAQGSLRHELPADRIAQRREAVASLLNATGEFVIELQRQRLPEEMAPALPTAIRVGRYYAEAVELAQLIAASQAVVEPLPAELAAEAAGFERRVLALLDAAGADIEGSSPERAAEALAAAQLSYHALKDLLLRSGAEGRVPVGLLVEHLDRLSNVRRMAEQMERGARYLWSLGSLEAGAVQGAEPLLGAATEVADAQPPVASSSDPGSGSAT